ncbi:MAG TPA: hypothetical protein P5567_11805 [Kiritimatiellia bacterium]|nr:hypothetical protein [Kiritimatiellia bacterium]HRZ13125.1 hypothetical protein [Kiritimatiellia bacterium]HSA17546.1 hypothetical protein [Kiritimatiellia bacterium]
MTQRNWAEGVWVPRWIVALAGVVVVMYVALHILVPPAWMIQRLDSPDGRRTARLLRTRYAAKESLVVKARDRWGLRTLFYSPPLTNDFRVDLGERLYWSGDSRRLFLEMEGRPVWGYDFSERRALAPEEIAGGTPGTRRAAPSP